MCGRFTLTELNPDVVRETFAISGELPPVPPRYNLAPTQPVATVVRDPETGDNQLKLMHWGLIPSWAKDPSIGSRMINARSETLTEKPSFRTPLQRRRCLILSDGFYEWQTQAGGKQPIYIRLAEDGTFAFAGLWERWTEPNSGDPLLSCTIITGPANELLSNFHDRMPIILPREDYDTWLDPSLTDTARLVPLLRPYPAEQMVAYPVSRRVNVVQNDDPSLIERAS